MKHVLRHVHKKKRELEEIGGVNPHHKRIGRDWRGFEGVLGPVWGAFASPGSSKS